ncbi:MAG: tetratricopeptide repeat protein [Deltaproteobacteria bacterium]|nr:tetratricopeptide repeat protein [Deltaproteobacteria bacterium]
MNSKYGIYSIAGSVIILFILSLAAFMRNLVWHDELSLWKRTVISSPNKSRPFNSLGVAYANKKLYDEAIRHFKMAIRNGSGLQEVHHYNLALAYQDKGVIEEAVFEFTEAIKLKPDYADARYRLGILYKDMGMTEKAEAELKKAVEYVPDRDTFRNSLGNIYLLQKRYSLALEEYKMALRTNPSNVESLYNLAITYDAMGMREDAVKSYIDFIMAAPSEYQSAVENANKRQQELSKKLLNIE